MNKFLFTQMVVLASASNISANPLYLKFQIPRRTFVNANLSAQKFQSEGGSPILFYWNPNIFVSFGALQQPLLGF